MQNKYAFLTKPSLTQKVSPYIKWIIILILIILLVFGLRSYVNSVYEKEMKKNNENMESIKNSFKDSVKKSSKSSADLVKLGVKLLENNQTEWAAIILEEAATRDPKYRDAAFYAGYAYLRQAEEIRNSKSEIRNHSTSLGAGNLSTEQYNNLAIKYLEKAKELDPIYPNTYELLAIAYRNIGDNNKSEIAYEKFQVLK